MALNPDKLKRFIEGAEAIQNDPEFIAFKAGVEHGTQLGRTSMKRDALTLLEEEYMRDEVKRGSVEGNALLNVSSKLANQLQVKQ